MSDTLWLIRKTLITTFKNYKNLLLYIGMPIVGILLASLIHGGSGETTLRLGIVNHDEGQTVTEDTVQFIKQLDHVEASGIKESEANDLIVSGELDAVLIFQGGFAESLRSGKPESVRIVSIKGTQVTGYVSSYLNAYIDNLATIGRTVQGDAASFDVIYNGYRQADFELSKTMVEDRSVSQGMTKQTIGYLLIFMLFSAVNLSGIIIKEKENRTYFRLLASPISARTYVISNVIVNLFMMMIQIAVTLIVMIRMFDIDPGIPFWQMFLILLLFALVAVALSLVIVAFAGSSMAASALQNMLIMPTCLLAGCLFPIELMPASIQRFAEFLPQHWLLDTFSKLQLGSSLDSVLLNLGILLAFAAALSLIAIYKFGRNRDMRSYI
ncbi:ABC transporter permease [Paenibacillus mendelii]|uniref:ABC transporter permease n=1 Tax=Paenibacillus mendelii TaxID=206163 RepID=A0ABV6J2N5_9BACL|nr:ABC transporter permease [Paenibacillus mendelii]MCQ6559240.1 ABC transporter permease [Paenibacillus mendelii]